MTTNSFKFRPTEEDEIILNRLARALGISRSATVKLSLRTMYVIAKQRGYHLPDLEIEPDNSPTPEK